MAFCRNCGNELSEGTKFCSNCGAPVDIAEHMFKQEEIKQIKEQSQNDEKFYMSDVYQKRANNVVTRGNSAIDKFGKFFGIILMILSFVDFFSDPALLTIILSLAIISGCIFCLARKYKLKGFTIMALILAIICLLCGFIQAKQIGLLKVPGNEKETTDIIVESPVEEPTVTTSEPVKEEKTLPQSEKPTPIVTPKASEEADSTETEDIKETVNGVDPDLKAFLDSYEAFMDEYVDFMKKYMNDPGNAIAMLSEYTDIMAKYEEFAKKVDAYDSDEMSTEDAKYYLDVLNRCNQKMLDIY